MREHLRASAEVPRRARPQAAPGRLNSSACVHCCLGCSLFQYCSTRDDHLGISELWATCWNSLSMFIHFTLEFHIKMSFGFPPVELKPVGVQWF